jgi:hypothetical protein
VKVLPPMVQMMAEMEGSEKAVRISESRLLMEDCVPLSTLNSSRTTYPRSERTFVARVITKECTWFRRAEGDINAIVAPGLRAGGTMVEGIELIP